MAGARRLHQEKRQHILLNDPVNQFPRATTPHGEGVLRGGVAEGQGTHEGSHAGPTNTM